MGPTPPDPELLAVFREEVTESVDVIHDSLLRIERNEADRADLLEDVLRLAHDLKGSAPVVGFGQLGRLAHALETRLLRWRTVPVIPAGEVDLAFRSTDTLKELSGDQPGDALKARAKALAAELESETQPGPADRRKARGTDRAPTAPPPAENERRSSSAPDRRQGDGGTLRVARAQVERVADDVAVMLADSLGAKARLEQLDRSISQLQSIRLPGDGASKRELERTFSEVDASTARIRVAFGRLGETLRQLDSHARDLDDQSRALCLVHVNPLLVHLERVARKAAQALGKDVDIVIEGRALLVGPTLVEALKGPLTHAVRNAVDHGIEPPSHRRAAGKPQRATLRISMSEVGDRLHCEVSDDGRGIDVDAVRGRLGSRAESMDDRQVLHAVLRAGISTRDAVTQMSGRGLGLGSLAVTADRLRGNVSIDSSPGRGCTLKLYVPLQMSLLAGLVVEAGGSTFVLPLAGLDEVERGEGRGAPLASIVGLTYPGRPSHVITLKGRDRNVLVGVDEVRESIELVRRPVNPHLGRIPFVEGVTTLPSGEPVLILDVREIADACGGASDHDTSHDEQISPGGLTGHGAPRILLVDDSATLRVKLGRDLGEAGFEVVLAADGQAALEKLAVMSFAAIVTDVQMPNVSGLELLSSCAGKLPVLLITAFSEAAERKQVLALGAAAYIAKSDHVGVDVIDALNGCLSHHTEVTS
jgi:chemotaxis protein histidine kinase CheA/CheY-like chemotaxis protein